MKKKSIIYISIELDVEKQRKTIYFPSPVSPSPRNEGGWGIGIQVSTQQLFAAAPSSSDFPLLQCGHPGARVFQDKLPLSWGPPQAEGISMMQHLELLLLTLVSAGLFLTPSFPIHFLMPLPILKPVSPEMLLLGCGAQACPAVGFQELSVRAASHSHCPAALQHQSLATYTLDTKIWHLRMVDGV